MSTRENLNLKIDIFEIYNVYKYIKYSVFYAGLAFSKNQSEEWYPMKIQRPLFSLDLPQSYPVHDPTTLGEKKH